MTADPWHAPYAPPTVEDLSREDDEDDYDLH